MTTVGILAVHGDVEAHARALERLGVAARRVLRADEIEACDGIILPGGESTTISKGMDRLKLWEPLMAFAKTGRPMLGTCAGAILLSREARSPFSGSEPVPTLGILDAIACRNAYGTQVDSFRMPVDTASHSLLAEFPCVFIRAPRLEALGAAIEVLARVDGEPVAVREGAVWATTFHPELTDDSRLHQAWLGA